MITGMDQLEAVQRRMVEAWLSAGRVVEDHSWGQTDAVLLEVETAD